jgi:hypothetical protein
MSLVELLQIAVMEAASIYRVPETEGPRM